MGIQDEDESRRQDQEIQGKTGSSVAINMRELVTLNYLQ